METDWSLVDVDRLARLACPSCERGLAGGLMRQVEWTTRRCVVVVTCPNCNAESMVVLESGGTRRSAPPPIDVDDVRRAHEALARAGRMSDLFPA
jgi:RNase P subunit RPR2